MDITTIAAFAGFFAMVLAWLATPDVLCLLPGIDLTMSEHECCLVMGENCGTVSMPGRPGRGCAHVQ